MNITKILLFSKRNPSHLSKDMKEKLEINKVRMIVVLLASTASMLIMLGCAKTDSDYYKEGCKHRDNNNLAKSVECFELAANMGNSQAAFDVGMMYREGNTIEPDALKAAHFLKIAAEKGNLNAQVFLAELYKGKGNLNADKQKMVYWLTRAADSGDAYSIRNLAHGYEYGKFSLEKNIPKAIMMYRIGGLNKNPGPEGDRGASLCYGDFVKAALNADMRLLGVNYLNENAAGMSEYMEASDLIFKKYHLNQDADAFEAYDLFRESASKGCAEGLYAYGAVLYWGLGGIKRNPAKGLSYWQRAGDAGLQIATIMLRAQAKGELLSDNIDKKEIRIYATDDNVPDSIRVYGTKKFGDFELGDSLPEEWPNYCGMMAIYDYKTGKDLCLKSYLCPTASAKYFYTPITKKLYRIELKFTPSNEAAMAIVDEWKKYFELKTGFFMKDTKARNFYQVSKFGEKDGVGIYVGFFQFPGFHKRCIVECIFTDTDLVNLAQKESNLEQ